MPETLHPALWLGHQLGHHTDRTMATGFAELDAQLPGGGWPPPRLRTERLRRLQLAAQAHDGPAFVLREMAAQQRPTAATLRLALRPGGADSLSVRLLKRRGPPLPAPLSLQLPSVLSAAA